MSTETTPAAAAETPAHTQSSTAESTTPALNIPAPEAETQGTQPPAAATQDTGTPEPQEGTPEGTPEDESKKANKVPARERISQLTAQRNEAEMRARAAEAELARLRQPLRPPGPDATQDEVDRFNVKAAVREARAEDVAQEAQEATAAAWQSMRATFEAKADAVADRMPGLKEAFLSLPVVSNEVANFVSDSDVGAEVAYFLTKNPNEAARISRLPSYQQGIELARIEGRISAAPKVRTNTNAPPPPPRMGGSPSTAAKDPSSMSMKEYEAWRNGGKAAG